MSPYSCPDFICDLDAEDSEFVSLKYKQSDIDKTLAYCTNVELDGISINETPLELEDHSKLSKQEIEACKTQEFNIKLKTKPCNCSICRHDYTKIGIKKSIKWNSKMYNYYKKELKKLRDKGIRSGSLTSKNILEIKYAIVKQMALYHCEQSCLLRFRRHACKMKYRKQRYERYKQLGILY